MPTDVLALPLTCAALRVMRAHCGCSQRELEHALGLPRNSVSKLERNHKGKAPDRSFLVRAAKAMGRPESFVDRQVRNVERERHFASNPRESVELDDALEVLAEQAGAGVARHLHGATQSAGARMLVASERANAEQLWAFYTSFPKEARRKAVEEGAYFHRWGFVERLWLESLNAAADDAGRALGLAELALAVTGKVDVTPELRGLLTGLALAGVANARRVLGDLLGAERDMARAREHWSKGGAQEGDWLDAARFLALEAALLRAQRHFPEALERLAQARAAAKPGTEAEYLIRKGNILLQLQRHEEAAQTYLEALGQSGPGTSPRLAWWARFNLAVCHCALQRPQEAQDQVPSLREAAARLGNGLDLLRIRWLEGQIQAAFGQLEDAARTLAEVREGFLSRGILNDAALAGLERAWVLLRAGDTATAKEEAPELAEVFRQLRVAPELLATLTLFCTAVETERATADLARQVLLQLRQAGIGPVSVA